MFTAVVYVGETRELFLVDRRGCYIYDLRLECVTLREQRTGLATVFDENTKKGIGCRRQIWRCFVAPSLRALVLTAQGLVKDPDLP